jgi:hypothetical protein
MKLARKNMFYLIITAIVAILVLGAFYPFEFVNDIAIDNSPTSTGSQTVDSTTSNAWVGQCFQLTAAQTIGRVGFYAKRSGTTFSGHINVQLWKDTSATQYNNPDVMLKEVTYSPILISSTGGWTYVQLDYNAIANELTYAFLIIDFSEVGFIGSSNIKVYYAGNTYGNTPFVMWTNLGYYTDRNILFRIYNAEERCWKCNGGTPQSNNFPIGTVCGAGSAASWPYNTQADAIADGCGNQGPTCTGVTGPSSGAVSTSYSFTATGTDPDSDPLSFWIDWGDSTNTGWIANNIATASHSWTTEDTFEVTARVKDPVGLISDYCPPALIQIGGGGTGPTACFTVTGTIEASVDAGCSVGETQYAWDWENDGTWDIPYASGTVSATHTFTTSGSHTIKLGVKDGSGLEDTTTRDFSSGSIIYIVTVTDSESIKISNAIVNLKGTGTLVGRNYLDKTNENGIVSFSIVAGTYTMSVDATDSGYSVYETTITITQTPSEQTKAITLKLGFDLITLVIALIISIVIFVVFFLIARLLAFPFKHILLIVGIMLSILLFYLIEFVGLF